MAADRAGAGVSRRDQGVRVIAILIPTFSSRCRRYARLPHTATGVRPASLCGTSPPWPACRSARYPFSTEHQWPYRRPRGGFSSRGTKDADDEGLRDHRLNGGYNAGDGRRGFHICLLTLALSLRWWSGTPRLPRGRAGRLSHPLRTRSMVEDRTVRALPRRPYPRTRGTAGGGGGGGGGG